MLIFQVAFYAVHGWKGLQYKDEREMMLATFDDASTVLQEYTAGEEIQVIWLYQCPLWQWKLTQYVFNRLLYWSLEKNIGGITIQRNKSEDKVKDFFLMSQRPKNILLIRQAEVHCNAEILLYMLAKAEHFQKPCKKMSSNCTL